MKLRFTQWKSRAAIATACFDFIAGSGYAHHDWIGGLIGLGGVAVIIWSIHGRT